MVLDRFLKYISYDTQSDEESSTSPSTAKQLILLDELERELKELGAEVTRPSCGYVFARIPANTDSKKVLAFSAHVDTAPAVSGANIKPQIITYQGGDVLLNKEENIIFSAKSFPEINRYIGQQIVFTDGTTLLGADDKAGVAIIMTACEYMLSHPEFKHGEVKIAFTYDEEVGRGTEHFDVKEFGADYGYTVDGGELGELSYENFNAAAAVVNIRGVSVHPGEGYGKLINAIDLFSEFHSLLPIEERPSTTRDYQGFYMVNDVKGGVDELVAKYIIRDHDKATFEKRKKFFETCVAKINQKYGKDYIKLDLSDSYYNMREIVSQDMHLIDNALKAFEMEGITPFVVPTRGGTDGANLSFMGMPCPNLSAGGHNFHGRFEYIPVPSMEKMVSVILNIISLYQNA